MNKVIRDGKVAVLYSPGYGAGWYTWNREYEDCLFDPDIVAAIERGDLQKATRIAEEKWPGGYWGGGRDLEIEWLKEGTLFEIQEYDGYESIRVDYSDLMKA